MKRFLPEGMLFDTPDNKKYTESPGALAGAMKNSVILEGRALMCTRNRDLIVETGGTTLTIPRSETALGIDSGKTRDIAVLSRVGKCVCFMVVGLEASPDAGAIVPKISRRAAQKAALEHLMDDLCPGDIIPAVVTHVESFGAFVDIGCGITSFIGIENISVARIAHPSERFTPGQHIFVLVTAVDREIGRVYLSHKELLGTWEENAAMFAPGDTVAGVVRGVKDYGVFVELAPNLSGLSEYRDDLRPGDGVSVFIKSVLPEKHKVKLAIIDVLGERPKPKPLRYFTTSGALKNWRYF